MDYPLEHLQSFKLMVPAKNPLQAAAVLQVTFSCHVYSQKWQEGFAQDHYFKERGEERAFCAVRYGCSLGLPQLINQHVLGKAYEGRDSKGAKNHFFYALADGIPYPIFFRLGRATKIPGANGILHVISAYQKPNLPARHRFQAVNFARLVHLKCPPPAPK